MSIYYKSIDISTCDDDFSETLITGIGNHTLLLQNWYNGNCINSISIDSSKKSIEEIFIQQFPSSIDKYIVVDSIYYSRFEENLRNFPYDKYEDWDDILIISSYE